MTCRRGRASLAGFLRQFAKPRGAGGSTDPVTEACQGHLHPRFAARPTSSMHAYRDGHPAQCSARSTMVRSNTMCCTPPWAKQRRQGGLTACRPSADRGCGFGARGPHLPIEGHTATYDGPKAEHTWCTRREPAIFVANRQIRNFSLRTGRQAMQ